MKTVIKFNNEEATIRAIQRRHDLSYVDVYKLKSKNARKSFILDGLEYDVECMDENKKVKKRTYYTISKEDEIYTGLVPKEVSHFVKRSASVVSSYTIKTGSAVIGGWLVVREVVNS